VIALGLALAGLALILGSEALARRYERRYVIGRILAVAPQVTLEEAIALAHSGQRRYVRVHGRITSEEEFPDENDRPLVYRRKRLEIAADGRRRRILADDVEGVPFGLESRGASVAVDAAALNEGLVVLERESVGRVADLPAEVDRAGAAPEAVARLVVEQVSAVEHAFVCGVPQRQPDGRVVITSGARRPLILTTLDVPAAMRVLAARRRVPATILGALVVFGVVLLAAALVAAVIELL